MVPRGRVVARTRRTATSTSGAPTRRRTPAKEVVFPDQEDSIWTLSEKTGEWYLHKFYKEQPDLNVTNPRVRDEVAKIMGFWLQLGLSGFRVDAVPFFLETAGRRRRRASRTRTTTCATCARWSAGARAAASCSAR